MWALVYNGILHSLAGGAELDRTARLELRIDEALRTYQAHDAPADEDVADDPRVTGARSDGRAGRIDTATLTDEQVRQLMDQPSMREVMAAEDSPAEASPSAFRQMFPTIDRQHVPGVDDRTDEPT